MLTDKYIDKELYVLSKFKGSQCSGRCTGCSQSDRGDCAWIADVVTVLVATVGRGPIELSVNTWE